MPTLRALVILSTLLLAPAMAAADVLPPDAATATDAGIPRTDDGGCSVGASSASVTSIVLPLAAIAVFAARRRWRA